MFTNVNNPVFRRIRNYALSGRPRATILALHCACMNNLLSPLVFSKIFTYAVLFLVDKKGLSVLQVDYLYSLLPSSVAHWFIENFYTYFSLDNIIYVKKIKSR